MPDAPPSRPAEGRALPRRARIRPARGSGPDAGAEEITGIRTAFPEWNVWRSDEGGWWASRRHPLRPSQWPDGYALTVAADQARELLALITRQPADPR
jgi:hypothetical protein